MADEPQYFPVDRFELLVRLYLDGAVDWDVMHNFAIAHIDDHYEPEFQRPVEDLHLMFLPEYRVDAENPFERPHMKYLLSILENLKHEVNHLGAEQIRQREISQEAPQKTQLIAVPTLGGRGPPACRRFHLQNQRGDAFAPPLPQAARRS
jgi:hypothetical protein